MKISCWHSFNLSNHNFNKFKVSKLQKDGIDSKLSSLFASPQCQSFLKSQCWLSFPPNYPVNSISKSFLTSHTQSTTKLKGLWSDHSLTSHNHSFKRSLSANASPQTPVHLLVTDCLTDSFNVESPRNHQPVSPAVVVESQTHKHQIDCNATTINHHPLNTIPAKNPKALTTKENHLLGIPPTSSTATSESGDNLSLCEGSLDSLEVKMWHKSETESMAPSCSSISMDSSADEVTFEFMRRFVLILFTESGNITLELKHQFGQYARVSWTVAFSQPHNQVPEILPSSPPAECGLRVLRTANGRSQRELTRRLSTLWFSTSPSSCSSVKIARTFCLRGIWCRSASLFSKKVGSFFLRKH